VVLSAIAPLSALPVLVSVIVALFPEVVNDDVPPTVSTPVCVRLPTVSVIVRLPPTFEAPSTVALALVKLALPFAPLVVSDAAPVSRLALLSVMVAFEADVVNEDVPPTVSTPLCVRLPTESVTVRFRPMLEAASVVATLFVRLASAVPALVLSAIAPFSALPVLVSVMVALLAEVVNDEVPATNGKSPGQPCKLNDLQRRAIAGMIESGPWRGALAADRSGAMDLRGIPHHEATGERIFYQPTAVELASVHATNYGVGLRFVTTRWAELMPNSYAFVEWSQLRSSDPTLDRWRFFSGVLIQY